MVNHMYIYIYIFFLFSFRGVFGSGPGILLALTLISAYYDICKEEHKKNDGYNTLLF